MSSNLDSLVEAITELVIAELQGAASSPEAGTSFAAPSLSQAAQESLPGGAKVLVAPGPRPVDDSTWSCLMGAESIRFSGLAWKAFCEKRFSRQVPGWKVESVSPDMTALLEGYQALVLAGSDLAVLSGIANLGSSPMGPVGSVIASVSMGLPVFVHDGHLEQLRRHSSRLSSGFVRKFEELYREAQSFGIEFGGDTALGNFLARVGNVGQGSVLSPGSKSSGRDVVTVEDVEAVRDSGSTELRVAMGAIVTPLARQRASEWGVEIVFQ